MRVRAAVWIAAPLVIFAASARAATTHRVGRVEERAFRAANAAPEGWSVPTWLVMQSGSLGAVFAVAALLRRRDPPAAAKALTAGTTVWGVVKLIKPMIGRGRPAEHLRGVRVRGTPQSGLGFPSGHSAVATTLALLATRRGTPVRNVALGTAAATGVGRIYVGAHLPLDVVAGWALGVAASEVGQRVVRPQR